MFKREVDGAVAELSEAAEAEVWAKLKLVRVLGIVNQRRVR